jgi:Tfp pilus assembly protein PilF
VFCLLAGCALRFVGLTRGSSDLVLPEAGADIRVSFYQFHPDEETLVSAALSLSNPLQPPLTAYGTLPMYLARGVLELSALVLDRRPLDLGPPQSRAFVFGTVRGLAAGLSCLSLGLVFLIGRRCFDRWTASLALSFVAMSPVAIQQAHFYTVDGIFTFLSLVAFAAFLKALKSPRRWKYLISGVLVGATAAVRLNGLLLGLILLAGHLLSGGHGAWAERGRRAWERLLQLDLWLSGFAALSTLLILQPYLLANWDLLWQQESTSDFSFSLGIARGEMLRTWTLVDVHTVPYLHYWTDLWPLAVGWPLVGVFALGMFHALWRGTLPSLTILLWVVIYFLLFGGLHTKHVRYLLPLLPFMSLLAADLCRAVCQMPRSQTGRRFGLVLTAALVGCTTFHGFAFSRVYAVEDSRIQAGRWVRQNLEPGATVGVERGGFSVAKVISSVDYRQEILDSGALFFTQGYSSCEASRQYMEERLAGMDCLVITDVNRSQQFAAVPERYPVAADFYRRLAQGRLGFELVQRFKTYPALLGLTFTDDGAEPSFLGYDHPAVMVYRRGDHFGEAMAEWRRELATDTSCVDGAVRKVAEALHQGDLARALVLVKALRTAHPENRLVALIEADIYRHLGDTESEEMALAGYLRGYGAASRSAHRLPWATATSLVELGLIDLALSALYDGIQRSTHLTATDLRRMAASYIHVGHNLRRRDELAHASEAYEMSTLVHEEPVAYNNLGIMAHQAGRPLEALSWWEQSLSLDETQVELHQVMGETALGELRDYRRALLHLRKAVELDPQLASELGAKIAEMENGLVDP